MMLDARRIKCGSSGLELCWLTSVAGSGRVTGKGALDVWVVRVAT